jgi:pimeloyl-ACP methyl ester carboxylesterase
MATVVLLHGAFLSRVAWNPVEDALSSTHRVISIDLPAHGRRAGESFAITDAAAMVAAEIEAQSVRPVVLVGHSLGGYVAVSLAASRPDLVQALVLSGSTRSPRAFSGGPFSVGLAALALLPDAAFDLGFRLYGARPWRRADRRLMRAAIKAVMAQDPEWRIPGRGPARAIRSLRDMDFWSELGTCRGPTLILNGDLDLFFRAGERRALRTARNARLSILPNAGHQAPLEQPIAFAESVLRFVGQIQAAQPSTANGPDPASQVGAECTGNDPNC